MFLILVVFFLLISKIIPPTSIVVPLISKYLLFTFIMNILSVLNTCLTINFYYKRLKIEQLPESIRIFVTDMLPRILFMKKRKKKHINNSPLRNIDNEKNRPKTFSSELKLNRPNSPIICSKLNNECQDRFDDSYGFKYQHTKKFCSHHDLVLASQDKKAKYMNLKGKNFESTTKCESKNNANELKNFNYYAKKWTSFENQNNIKKSHSTKTINKDNYYSLDNIKLTDRFLKVCKSVEYIGNLMKIQAELDEVIIIKFSIKKIFNFKFNLDKRRLEIYCSFI